MPKKVKCVLTDLSVKSFSTTRLLKGGDANTGPIQCRTNPEHCWQSHQQNVCNNTERWCTATK